jgi:hypothetical protein
MLLKNCQEPLKAADEGAVRNSSTPHRIKIPSLEEDAVGGCRRRGELDKRKATGPTLGAVQQPDKFVKIAGARGRKPLPRPVHQNVITDNHKLTEYFPVRRSVRKCKKAVLEEKQRDLENKLLCGVEDGLQVGSHPIWLLSQLLSYLKAYISWLGILLLFRLYNSPYYIILLLS